MSKSTHEHKKVVLKLENISKIYQMGSIELKALDKINFEVKEGERLSITGPSGSGKSTLLHILGLLDRPTHGKMHLGGKDVTTLDDNELSEFRGRQIGFIFQAFHLIPALSALENVALPMMFYNVAKKDREARGKRALERLGMGDRLNHLPSELSGGQRQRVAIARSLVNNPSILLADEPTGNLDSKSGEEVLKVFDELSNEGITIIVVTHDINIAKKSKRLVKLKDGRIIEDKLIKK